MALDHGPGDVNQLSDHEEDEDEEPFIEIPVECLLKSERKDTHDLLLRSSSNAHKGAMGIPVDESSLGTEKMEPKFEEDEPLLNIPVECVLKTDGCADENRRFRRSCITRVVNLCSSPSSRNDGRPVSSSMSSVEVPLKEARTPEYTKLCIISAAQPCLQTSPNSNLTYGQVKPFVCPTCGFKFSRPIDLKKHLRVHSGEKPYACEFCEFRSPRSDLLKIHVMSIHTGERPYACDYCDYRCIRSADLKRHVLLHTGEKPFACNLCSFKCRHSGHLKNHMQTHTGEKPFACEQCDYKSNRKASLKTHMNVHTGERPYSCEYCTYQCSRAADLRRHLKIHLKDKTKDSSKLLAKNKLLSEPPS